jgi:hypothetical protein
MVMHLRLVSLHGRDSLFGVMVIAMLASSLALLAAMATTLSLGRHWSTSMRQDIKRPVDRIVQR